MSLEQDVTELKVQVAKLETHYEYIKGALESSAASTNALSTKFDQVLQNFRDEQHRRGRMSKVWATVSHAATGGLTLLAAKMLHVPLNLG